MSLSHWSTHIPRDPLQDIHLITQDPMYHAQDKKKIFCGIDVKRHRYERWNPLQVACLWKPWKRSRDVVTELVFHGADLNQISLCGLNPLHLLILFLFFEKPTQKAVYLQRIQWYLSIGARTETPCIVYDTHTQEFLFLNALELFEALYTNSLRIDPYAYIPTFLHRRFRANTGPHKVGRAHLVTFYLLFFCFGAKMTPEMISRLKCLEWFFPMLYRNRTRIFKEYLMCRYKLSPRVKTWSGLQQRVNALHFLKSQIDFSKVGHWRQQTLFPRIGETHQSYFNHEWEDPNEFMPYEYVSFQHPVTGHEFYFHKSTLPHLFQTRLNPLTLEPLDETILRQWFKQLEAFPRTFHQLFTLEASLASSSIWSMEMVQEDEMKASHRRFVFDFLYSVLSLQFPYNTLKRLVSLPFHDLQYVCHVLSHSPFYFLKYRSVSALRGVSVASLPDLHRLFLQITCFYFLMDPECSHEMFYFAIEEGLQDLSCYQLISDELQKHATLFQQNFFEMILNYPSVGDIMHDRLGFVQLEVFYDMWQRFVVYDQHFAKKHF